MQKSNIQSKIGNDNVKQIEDLFKKINKDSEFEFIFFSKKDKHLTFEKYRTLVKFISKRASSDSKIKLVKNEQTLDISFSPEIEKVYRCTLIGKDAINTYMKKLSIANNHVIFRNLIKLSKKDDKIEILKKEKKSDQTIDIDDLYMRARLSSETKISDEEYKKLIAIDETQMDNIIFRYKERTSLYVYQNDKDYIRIDLTITKMDKKYNKLNNAISNYELELETMCEKPKNEILEKMYNEIEVIFKVVQQSNFIITKSEANSVIENYKNLLAVPKQNERSLYGRQPISLEIQYVESLANKYAVTDKADGERHFLVIFNNHVYLMNKNLDVKNTGIILKKEQERYNNSVIDGELIFLKNRHVFLTFDCLFNGGNDIRKEAKLEERLKNADIIINDCFVFNGQKGCKYLETEHHKEFNLNKTVEFHRKQIKMTLDNLNHDIEIEKQFLLVRRKYFIHSIGAKPWEIARYTALIWESYTGDPEIKCPYTLDGLIFQPNEQKYAVNKKDSRYDDYKWKPREKNSIDFYVEFLKDDDGNILTVYDNSYSKISDDPNAVDNAQERNANQTYRICRLHVGQIVGQLQAPVLFRENDNLYEAYIPLQNGEIRDIEGNILADKTVVEFYYNSMSNLPNKFKWIPMRTRYDKTEMVMKYKQNYGNFVSVADKVWQSIVNPVLMTDFEDLAKGNNPDKNQYFYDKKLDELRKRIGHDMIVSAAKEDKYFQLITKLGIPMRNFHNFIKSNIIFTFCHSMYQDNKQKSVLDLGCGRGGDQNRFYYAKVAFYVGVDYDRDALFNPLDSSTSRYNQQKRKPGFTKMFFIHGDQSNELDYESQFASLGGMDFQNKQLIERFFSKDPAKRTTFDVINCQFAIHYSFKNDDSLSNFKKNINNYLRNDGYVLITTFDGNAIRKLLKNKERFTQEYVNEEGEVKILFDIVKKYDDVNDDVIMGTGNAIDVHMAWLFNEGVYQTEYLVDEKFIIEEFKRDCNLELVTMDSFENQFNILKEYLTEYVQYEADDRTREGILKRAGEFYKSNSVNDGCKKYTDLEKYYVFRKNIPKAKKQKGGNNDLTNTHKYSISPLPGYDNNYSFINSIHHILKNHEIIPKTLSPKTFCSDMGIDYENDINIDSNFKKIAKNIVIYHANNDGKHEKILNGLNILLAERNKDDEYTFKIIEKGKKITQNDNVIMLAKEGVMYAPIYQIDSDLRNGIFHMDDENIKQLLELQ
ncbi:mRNA capping enzyme [Bodo saltans virus]|uniref:mRNA capping enzyme n=1 Tax=Bodo saltans virus TaxID=2024608 RepID=A0A2H4UVI3_9VIRU|nr:mRNA capping enzyme [Bodo saltans virus]ATZ80933.1 mRNA capping enzyme [Bodo saltans virus]